MEAQLRWAVNCTTWIPCKQEWLYAVACIQQEEIERIKRFVFRRDTKLALVGRLLIRAAVTLCLGIKNGEIRLGRTAKGKPILYRRATAVVRSTSIFPTREILQFLQWRRAEQLELM